MRLEEEQEERESQDTDKNEDDLNSKTGRNDKDF